MSTAVSAERKTVMVSEGNHIYRLTKFEEKTGPNGPYWEYTASVAEPGPEQGLNVVMRVSLSQNARWKMNEFLDAVGAGKEGTVVGEQFLGCFFRGHTIHTEFNGRVKAEIDVANALEEQPGSNLADLPVETYNPAPGGPTQSPSLVPGAQATPDDIPF